MTDQPNKPVVDDEIIEQLAAIEHERWVDWQKWCHKILRENNPSPEQGDILERWDRQIETPYANLSESEKQSDRDQVMRYWPIIKELIEAREKEAERRGQWTPPVDLNDPQYMLQFIDDPIEKFNMFIRKWCPDYSHLIDTDDNDGQTIRNMLHELTHPKKENHE